MKFIFVVIASLLFSSIVAQKRSTYKHSLVMGEYSVNIYAYAMNRDIKIRYFPQNANLHFASWKDKKYILMACSGAFSETWNSNSLPVGFTAYNGQMINRNIDPQMDGLVFIQDYAIEIGDLDELESGITTEDGETIRLYPRSNAYHRFLLSQAVNELDMTVFQTQLIYYPSKKDNFSNIFYGKKAERRFLSTCYKDGVYYSVIIDIPAPIYLNLAGSYAKNALARLGYYCGPIVNLDTGSKNIFLLGEGDYLINQTTFQPADATNLIIFYKE